jgi:hypothetical protein
MRLRRDAEMSIKTRARNLGSIRVHFYHSSRTSTQPKLIKLKIHCLELFVYRMLKTTLDIMYEQRSFERLKYVGFFYGPPGIYSGVYCSYFF